VAEELAQSLGIDRLLARLLVVRGVRDAGQAQLFLRGGLEHFHDPMRMLGMREAVERIRRALEAGEKIRIYGDYDADGVSSTTLMILLMRRLKADFDYYIPHRIHEGYGLNRGALELAAAQGVSLIVTVDTGISAREEIEYAKRLGIDVVVTDHHEPPPQLPEAVAIINPKQPGCPYPFKQLAGVGVALKLAQALTGELPEPFLEIAAIGTVADLMPLADENRLIVKFGLERMRRTSNVGLKALFKVAGVDLRALTAGHIAFSLAPRINASGRLEAADDAVRLLISAEEEEAERLARNLDELNRERQRIVDEMTRQAAEMIEEKRRRSGLPRVIVLAREHWNPGVIGIVASKLLERYYRPTVILGIDPESGLAKGSARSIPGFDLYRALTECRELFTHYGGHQAAAGMSLSADNIARLDAELNRLAALWLTEADFIPVLRADLECRLPEVTVTLLEQIEQLAPFGAGNPSPRFVFTGLSVRDKKSMGKENQHLKLTLAEEANHSRIEAVGFGFGHLASRISPTAKIDVLGELSVNEWNGRKKLQIVVHDLRIPHMQVFDWRGCKEPTEKIAEWLAPGRENGSSAADRRAIVVASRRMYGRLQTLRSERAALETAASAAPAEARRGDSDGHESASGSAAVWLMDEQGGIEPLNEEAMNASFARAEDIVLLSLPASLAALRRLIRRAEKAERWYVLFAEEETSAAVGLPSRDMFKKVYAWLRQAGDRYIPSQQLLLGLGRRSGFPPATIQFMIEVFEELSFIERVGNGYRVVPSPARQELMNSAKFRSRFEREEVEKALVFSSSQQLTEWIVTNAITNEMEDVR
jgi:single-stranded-DNA-specific exonuclease